MQMSNRVFLAIVAACGLAVVLAPAFLLSDLDKAPASKPGVVGPSAGRVPRFAPSSSRVKTKESAPETDLTEQVGDPVTTIEPTKPAEIAPGKPTEKKIVAPPAWKDMGTFTNDDGTPKVYAFVLAHSLSLEDQILLAAAPDDVVFLNDNFKDPAVLQAWKDKEATAPGLKTGVEQLEAVVLKVGDHPTTEQVVQEMERQGLRPATTRELFALSMTWKSPKYRLNSVGDGEAGVAGNGHYAHVYYQPNPSWYGAPGFAFSLNDVGEGKSWGFEKRELDGKGDSQDFFVGIKIAK